MSRSIGEEKLSSLPFFTASSYGETYFSFVNGQYTQDGGTHLSAFREGILKGVNEYCEEELSRASMSAKGLSGRS